MTVLSLPLFASSEMYHMEVGVHGGMGYYVGELAPHVFLSTREAYGAHFRYKFNERWAVQAKGLRQRVYSKVDSVNNPVWNIDATADFNFFYFGNRKTFNWRKVCPYVFAGVGCSVLNVSDTLQVKPYVPVGIGLKWKFHDRFQLQLAWQHNLYITPKADCLEGRSDAYPTNQNVNQSNLLNNDMTSTMTLSFVYEFAKHRYKAKLRRY